MVAKSLRRAKPRGENGHSNLSWRHAICRLDGCSQPPILLPNVLVTDFLRISSIACWVARSSARSRRTSRLQWITSYEQTAYLRPVREARGIRSNDTDEGGDCVASGLAPVRA